MRLASRLGYSDLGVNRRRIEDLRALLIKRGHRRSACLSDGLRASARASWSYRVVAGRRFRLPATLVVEEPASS